MYIRCKLALLAALTLLVSACATTTSHPGSGSQALAGSEIPAALQNHSWKLAYATDAQNNRIAALFPAEGQSFTLNFQGDRLNVTGGCNLRGGHFQLTPAQRLMIGPMPGTLMACDPALMQADQTLGGIFSNPLQLGIYRNTSLELTLVSANNETLVFTGQPTPESLYGPSTRIFLEVAPQKVACNHPLIPDMQCLQVRERHYDEKGLQVGKPAQWEAFYSNIEGYEHQEGIRNVLRIKRFTRPVTPADASSYVYILDMVVESEIVQKP